jgi:hypothetical protein
MNLVDNRKTNVLRHICFKFLAFGDGDDDDVPKLPEARFELKLFWEVLMALVSINELLILGKGSVD